ncbi:hypothetical protein QR680_005973 [Steinernema hermaphroditum]|uniref:Protein with SprT-like domain at the N terminus n=1 Tax=Steinernema hermaphroditum TaxID=289476 RepID=A0AA39HV96_9BILA|nr:hypothetical protein QR680_005973 [Steinernema hermaphroditum]
MSKWLIVNGVLTPIENMEDHQKKQHAKAVVPRSGASSSRGNVDVGLVDPKWELIDPTPDIFAMFVQFDQRFFWNSLGRCEIKWSKKMTSCAGTCTYRGRFGSCVITLSEPLLKLRPRKDLVETMLHEMIHAYLFVTEQNQDRDGHGPNFQSHMHRINHETGTSITIYHSFHAEVALYKQHHWRCEGPCRNRPPFYGWVKRATNRAPGPSDRWFNQHQTTCGGKFTKVKEPERPEKGPKRKADDAKSTETKVKKPNPSGQQEITKWFGGQSTSATQSKPPNTSTEAKKWIGGSGTLGGSSSGPPYRSTIRVKSPKPAVVNGSSPTKRKTNKKPEIPSITLVPSVDTDLERAIAMSLAGAQKPSTSTAHVPDDLELAIALSLSQPSSSARKPRSTAASKVVISRPEVITLGADPVPPSSQITCPSCGKKMPESAINSHLDRCLT